MSETPNYISHSTIDLENVPDRAAQQMVECFEREVAAEPGNTAHRLRLALLLRRVGRNEDAVVELKIVIDKGNDKECRVAEHVLGKMSG